MNSRSSHPVAAAVATSGIPDFADDLDPSQLPTDTQAAMEYLLSQLDPRRVKDHKVFPRVCMIHQIYGIVKDHTTVDRTLDQLIKNGTIRKFFLGGTGSDEFAVMFTADYVQQIEDAKAQYFKDIETDTARHSLSGSKRKIATEVVGDVEPTTKTRKILKGGKITATAPIGNGQAGVPNTSTTSDSHSSEDREDTVFDRFRELVTGGNHLEVMIQHLTLQNAIGLSDTDITLLIRYGLLNRMLAVPANPHLVNMTKTTNRGAAGGGSSTAASEAEASSLRAARQTIATLRAQGRSSPSSSTNVSQAGMSLGGGAAPGKSSSSSTTSSSSSQLSKEGISVQAAASRGEQVLDEIFYRFAIRQGGLFVSHFLKGRQEMLRSIKRKPFGDMLVSAIKAKSLRGSSLPHEFHIQDLIGSARVRSVDTTSGQLLKITQKGEVSARAGG